MISNCLMLTGAALTLKNEYENISKTCLRKSIYHIWHKPIKSIPKRPYLTVRGETIVINAMVVVQPNLTLDLNNCLCVYYVTIVEHFLSPTKGLKGFNYKGLNSAELKYALEFPHYSVTLLTYNLCLTECNGQLNLSYKLTNLIINWHLTANSKTLSFYARFWFKETCVSR
ncbi:hypothetical protein CVS40_3506 [Lucilia cuprina]|nr:hypothetical protein CVS40_3506 [Lucilia cuprina]